MAFLLAVALLAQADPTGRRTGEAPHPDAAKTLLETLDAASAAASKKLVDSKVTLTAAKLKEQIDLVRGAVLICYPVSRLPTARLRGGAACAACV